MSRVSVARFQAAEACKKSVRVFCLDGRGLGRASGDNRVNRGGSWNNNARNCRSANRNGNAPDNANNNLGVRVATAPNQTMKRGLEPAASRPRR